MASTSSGVRKISFCRDNRIGFRGNFPLTQRDFAPAVPSPLTMNYPTTRPEYKRAMSTKVNGPERIHFGHRRTQSLNMPQTQITNSYVARNDLRKSIYNRSSTNIANTREFYAAPAYNEASFLERQESMRFSTHSVDSANA